MVELLVELFSDGGPMLVLVALSVYSTYHLSKHIKLKDVLHREDIGRLLEDSKELHKTNKEDINKILDSAKNERYDYLETLERMNSTTNKAITDLNVTVTELKIVVEKELGKD